VPKQAYEDAINAASSLLSACSQLGLRCRDPPFATSRLLQHIGLGQYRLRSFWDHMAELSRGRYVLYKAPNAVFELRLSLERRKLMHVDGWVPVDYFDCRALSGRCSTSPQGLGAFIYVEGRVEGSEIRLNAINLLRMVDLVRPSTSAELLGALRDLLWGRGVERGLDLLLRLTNVDAVRLVLPRAPATVKDLLTVSPALRQALADLRASQA